MREGKIKKRVHGQGMFYQQSPSHLKGPLITAASRPQKRGTDIVLESPSTLALPLYQMG